MNQQRNFFRQLVLTAILTSGLMWLFLYVPTPYVIYEPGIAIPTDGMVKTTHVTTPSEGEFVLTAVMVKDTNLWEMLKASLDQERDVRKKQTIFQGRSEQQYLESMSVIMNESQQLAIEAAYRFAEVPEHMQDSLSIEAGSIGGPSAGLVFTLKALDLLSDEDLTRGATIAASGTITIQGLVGPVGGVKQKVIQTSKSGVELFLVPQENVDEALKQSRFIQSEMQIVGVSSLQEAIDAIASYTVQH